MSVICAAAGECRSCACAYQGCGYRREGGMGSLLVAEVGTELGVSAQ